MRPPQHETAHEPERRCIITGEHGPKSGLIRLALDHDGQVAPDVRARAPGRGAWIGVDRAALETAIAKGKLKGALARAFKTQAVSVPDDLAQLTEAALERTALDRLGLESRAGMLVTGSDRIEEAARSGKARLLLHASDASADGNRKLDQAWRVGREAEGSGETGLVLSVDRSILGAALGRENVVHIALIDRAAAQRVESVLARWHNFIGRSDDALPCEKGA
ncbi:MAG: DUF448 domain-containing protein [Chakrabartia sp.]